MASTRLLSAMLLLLTALGAPGRSIAQEERAEGPTPPRLARTNGEVSFWRPGADDWSPAQVNTALAAGDRLYVASGGEALVEIVSRAEVRVAGDTELGIASLETGYLQLEVPSGRAALDLQRLPDGQRIEVDTPNGAFMIDRSGYYRIDVADDTVFTVRRGGEATVIPADGDETTVREGEQVVLRGTESASIVTNRAPAPDEWDTVNERQYASRPARAQSAQYIPPDVAGVDDLDQHGEWRSTTDYGQVWVPRDVGPDWAPYTTGRWTYDPYYEWTWVDDASWGWAPYHYGRWVYANDYWGWAPGPVIAQPVYAPALVGFVGAPGLNISVNIGAPFFGWTALGWGEPCLPWWGPRGFRGRPYWGGWGGRRYVNNVYVDNRRIVNVDNIRRYRNFDARNGVVGIGRDRFGRGRNDFVRLGRNDVNNLQPIRGTLGVRPASSSLVAREGRGRRPPERMRNRTVVGTRAPQDPSRRLQRAGLRAPAPEQRGPQTRLTGRSRVREQDQRIGGRGGQRGDGRLGRSDGRVDGQAPNGRRDERRERQALRGQAPPPPRDRAQQGSDDRFGRDGGRAMRRDRRDGVDPNRQAMRGRDADRGPDVRDDRNGRNQRGDAAPPAPRQERRANRNDERRERRNGGLTTTPPPNLDGRDAERRASRGRDRRQDRAQDRPRDRRGAAPAPPRAERAPQADRRQAQPPRAERQPRQERNRDVQQPRQQREREARQPRPERQERRQESMSRPRREAPSQRAERRENPQAMRQQRMAPYGGGGNARRERVEPPRASSARPELRQQAPRGGGGGGDGGRRGGGQGGGGRERGGNDRGDRRQREG
jgi:hypothetical protein